MAAKPTDRRIQKTQRLLRDALVSLIHEKSYDSIAVKEILDRANVGRSTFYMHFRDKHELLVSGINEMIRTVHSTAPPASVKGHEKFTSFSLPIFEYHDRHRHSGTDRMGTNGRAIVHEHLRKVLSGLIAEQVGPEGRREPTAVDRLPPDLLVEYVAATFILVLNWWLDTKSPLTAKDVDDVFRSLIRPALLAA